MVTPIDKPAIMSALAKVVQFFQNESWIPPNRCQYYLGGSPQLGQCLGHSMAQMPFEHQCVIERAVAMVTGKTHPVSSIGTYVAMLCWQNDPKTTQEEVLRVLKQARSLLGDYL